MNDMQSMDGLKDEVSQFKELGKIALQGIEKIYLNLDFLTRWVMAVSKVRLQEVQSLLENLDDYDAYKDSLPNETIAGFIKLYCGMAINYYCINTFIPIAYKLAGINIFTNTDLLSDMHSFAGNFKPNCLTKRELFAGLKYLGETESRTIVSSDSHKFDELFSALCNDDFIKFKGLVDESNLEILSHHTIFRVFCKRLMGPRSLNSKLTLISLICRNKHLNDALCELAPSHISYWDLYDKLRPNLSDCNDSRYISQATSLYNMANNYLAELDAVMQFVKCSRAVGRAKRQAISKYIDRSQFLVLSSNIQFNPNEVSVSELFAYYPIYSDLAIKYIRQEMKNFEFLSEYEDSSIGFNLERFLMENFIFCQGKYNHFKNNEFKYFSKLCDLMAKIYKDKRGGQKYTYAFLYLFFPVDKNQNSALDTLSSKRLNVKYLNWKDEPKNTDDAFQRLIKYFPDLKQNYSSGQPAQPSRSREAINKWITDGEIWLTCFMRDIWTPNAIKKSGFQKITSEKS